MAFRCKGRQFWPSCHARRLAEWSLWLSEHLLAPVAHRQVVLTLPKRLRAYFIHDRRGLGLLSRIATRALRTYVQAALGDSASGGSPDAVPGLPKSPPGCHAVCTSRQGASGVDCIPAANSSLWLHPDGIP